VEVGAFVTSRSLSYSGGAAPVGYSVTAAAGPWVGVEFFPLALVTNNLASGVGVIADYGTSLGLNSTAPSGASIPTTLWWLRLGAEWRLRPFSTSEFAIIPSLSYLQQDFTLSPAYAGLPNSSLSGLESSLRLDIPVSRSLSILAGGSYVYWWSAQQLVGSTSFYSSGSAGALEAKAGLSLQVWGPLSLRGLWFYSVTSYTLGATTQPYLATGAKDQYVGGRLTLFGAF
jgi:hypothetical protein